ncbi:hypothetical protein TRFO_07705 [Tritrichomonas foetus]|uniref:ODAD1 central coiled coil region domain-containing protein n=1 Tax=Tritrichomonas foetus TaxID=1144522 RepID=A0A1J4JRG8_9EUKA|nr:hypothetical protein TRFO_07705 [Tritrichomonas foetus]|eukprot:OHT01032.1 hypothetical protein TRFO_07705 [Tritrichomonas foetus]
MMKLPQDDILNIVRRQQRAIHKQKQANDTIRNEITEYENQIRNLDKDIEKYKNNEELQKLHSQFKSLTNKNSIIAADLAAEEGKRKKLEEEVSKANSKAGGLFQQLHENEQLQSRLRTMENRLDKALLRYNKTLIKLASMRSEIDETRKNRATFRNIIKNADMDSQAKDQELTNLISISNDAYSERDRMKMELVRIKQAEKEDIQLYETELSRLNQTIEGQRLTQNRPRQQSVVPSINSQMGSQNDQQEELTQLTDQLQTTIQKTLDLTGMASVEELIAHADEVERENFSLYNFVVEHGANKSKLQDEIDALELQHQVLLKQVNVKDDEQSEKFQELTNKIENITNQLNEVNETKAKNEAEFTSIYEAIQKLFEFYECSWDEAPDETHRVGPMNAMFCLSQIENAIANMMNEICEKTKVLYQMRGQDPKSLLVDDKSDASQAKSHTKAVERDLTKEKCIESNKPLTLEEMRALLG